MFGVLISAFAGSLAAVLVSFWIEANRQRGRAKADLIYAISRHCERLGQYSSEFWAAEAFARTKFQGSVIPGAPEKPSIRILEAALLSAGSSMVGDAKMALAQIVKLAKEAESQSPENREVIAEWEAEASRLNDLAILIGQWDGRKAALPTPADLGHAAVMS